MFEFFSKLLLHKQLQFENGKIILLGQPAFILPGITIVSLIKKLEGINKENLVYLACKDEGLDWFTNMYKNFGIKKRDVIEWGLNLINLAGYGKSSILKLDETEKIMIFTLENSVVAQLYGKSENCVDHLFRGYATGAGQLLFGGNCEGVETSCIAKGDKICKFYIMEKGKFDLTDSLVKKQLEI